MSEYNPKVIITKNGATREIPKITWETMGKATDGWSFVGNADPNDKSLPNNVKTAAKLPDFIPEEVLGMQTLRKNPEMVKGKPTLKSFTDQEVIDEYLLRNQAGGNSIIVDRETKLVRMEQVLNSVADQLMRLQIPGAQGDVAEVLAHFIKSVKEDTLLAAQIKAIQDFITPMFDEKELTKDARTRLTSVMDMVSALKAN